ncbi:MAG: alpha/beta hydrolase [Elainellaceae cyanobacterium]
MAFKLASSIGQRGDRLNYWQRLRKQRLQPLGWQSLVWAGLSALATTLPVRAAERIEFSYNLFEFYLPVESLETYAQTGMVDSSLAFYFQMLDPAAAAQMREALQVSHQISAWQVSQLLYAPIGEESLRNIGALIQTDSRQNGFYALRAALIQSAADPEGLSLLGVLRHFPTESVHLDVALILQLADRISHFAALSEAAVNEIQIRAQAVAAEEDAIDLATLPPLQNQGPFQFTQEALALRDEQRDRNIPTDLYVPVFGEALPTSIPVVVYSHGYGETRETAAPFLELLASYGFVVAAPEHVGSDYQFQQDLLIGLTNESFAASEFVDRPLDISYVLDVLEQKNATEFNNRLNLQQVGAFGHSFGGYTVLMLGGATVDFEQLQDQCQQDFLLRSLDTALLLQCRALELESAPQSMELLTNGQLRDPRIQSVMAVTPVAGAILGQQGLSQINIPVFLFSGGSDPVTPLVPEQLRAFSWLTTPDRYLLITDNAAHSAEITEVVNRFLLPANLDADVNEELAAFLTHLRSVGIAFMQVYVAGQLEYRPYLQASFVDSLSVSPFDFSLIRSFPPEELEQSLRF